MSPLSPELYAAALAAGFTGLLWIPIILNRLGEMGLWPALQNPQPDMRPQADWAFRLESAHRNAIENLVVFAPLAVIVHLLDLTDGLTAAMAYAFLASRVAHAAIYTAGVPLLRTIAFVIGFAAQMVLLLRIAGWV